jgi:hypothetical protein
VQSKSKTKKESEPSISSESSLPIDEESSFDPQN